MVCLSLFFRLVSNAVLDSLLEYIGLHESSYYILIVPLWIFLICVKLSGLPSLSQMTIVEIGIYCSMQMDCFISADKENSKSFKEYFSLIYIQITHSLILFFGMWFSPFTMVNYFSLVAFVFGWLVYFFLVEERK